MTTGTALAPLFLAAPLVVAAALSGCAAAPAPAPARAVCDALRPALPTWSRADSERSKIEGARFLDVWEAVCNTR